MFLCVLSADLLLSAGRFVSRPELTAGRLNILPFALTHNGRDILGPKRLFKAQQFFRRRRAVRRSRCGIVGNKIQLGLESCTNACQLLHMFRLIVHTCDNQIFQGDALSCLERILFQGTD